jgi:hypothetical protein
MYLAGQFWRRKPWMCLSRLGGELATGIRMGWDCEAYQTFLLLPVPM